MPSKITLPKTFRRDWLAALRSGRYKQGQDQLCTREDDGKTKAHWTYCCIGLACRLTGVTPKQMGEKGTVDCLVSKGVIKKVSLIARALPGHLTLGMIERETGRKRFVITLMRQNDDNKTFPQIADYIEQNTRGV